jgi:hypothetical protein
MGVAPGFKAVHHVGPRTRATAALARTLHVGRARLTEGVDEAQRLGRVDAMTVLGSIHDAIDRALDALT